ncbi:MULTISPECIES: hypothetical protein [unclassified Wolbachia]|nr:hypothetical protein [Wolbachia endosymbiont (group A) of Apoderus coryli]
MDSSVTRWNDSSPTSYRRGISSIDSANKQRNDGCQASCHPSS